jgi:hypothetical protein
MHVVAADVCAPMIDPGIRMANDLADRGRGAFTDLLPCTCVALLLLLLLAHSDDTTEAQSECQLCCSFSNS